MSLLITAALSTSIDGIPDEIVYLPEGEHKITATVDGKPNTITVNVPAARGAEITGKLQAALVKRHSGNVRPHFAFQHKQGAASGIPKSFRYQPGAGIMCAVDWSGSGATAIRNKDFSYFSPVFLLGDDGTPDSLPEKGELGSLVNEPAFRTMPRIAASDAGGGLLVGKPGSATALIEARAKQMVAAGEASHIDEAIGMVVASDPELYRVSCGEKHAIRPSIEAEIEAMLEGLEPSAREKLDAISDEIYLKGEVKSEADAKVLAIQRNPHLYQEFRDAQDEFMRKCNPPRQGEIQSSSIEEKAKSLVTAGMAKTLDDAICLVAASDPSAYTEYLKTLR